MPIKKFSQITAAGRASTGSDRLIGVDSGDNDLLFQGGNIRKLTAATTYYVAFYRGTLAGGSAYTNGTYLAVALTGGAGSGATSDIVVSGGAVIIVRFTAQGTGYGIGNVLSAAAASVGGTGSGFTFTITGIGSDLTSDGTNPTTPFRNAQTLYDDVISKLDFNQNAVTMQIADGRYLPVVDGDTLLRIAKSWIGEGSLTVVGNAGGDSTFDRAVVLDVTGTSSTELIFVNCPLSGDFIVAALEMYTAANCNCIVNRVSGARTVSVINCAVGGSGIGPDEAIRSSRMESHVAVSGRLTLTSDMITLFQGGSIVATPAITALVPITNASALVCNQFGGAVVLSGVSWAGSYSGRKFFVGEKDQNPIGVIFEQLFGGGDSPIPGTQEGLVQGNGVYWRRDFATGENYSIHGIVQQADTEYGFNAPTTGFSYTIGNGEGHTILDPSGTLAAGTITMPPNPNDGVRIEVRTSQIITSLTVSPNSGQSIKGVPTTLAAGGCFTAMYRESNTTWYCGK